MRHRLNIVVALAVAGITTIVGAPAAAAPSTLGTTVAGAPVGVQMVDALVVLRSQADLTAVRGRTRAERLADVKRVLRAKADSSQRDLLTFLRARAAQQRVTRIMPLWVNNEIKVRAEASVISELAARPDVRAVRADRTISAPTPAPSPRSATSAPAQPNIAKIHAPELWDLGYRGQGVVVANMDTGVDVSHPELGSRWRGGTNSWYDPNGEHPNTPTDISGHGTQTMGVMVAGEASGSALGVAPGATWVGVKIFNDQGSTQTSTIHQGFQWLLDPDGNPATADAPNVVNNSWSMAVAGCDLEFQQDLRGLRAGGIVPVFAAGNYGPLAGTTYGPAALPEALAVGATDSGDVVDPSSSRGPSACSSAINPKLVAPGVGIRTTDLFGGYATQSGTSLAAPHVSGALALLLSAFPGLSADQQESALINTAADLGTQGLDGDYGYGRIDSLAAYNWLRSAPDFAVSTSPSSMTAPAGASASYTVTVSGVNGFASDVALSLSGWTAAQGSWSFTPPVLQGGSGTAELTVTTSATIPPGSYPLTVTGTVGPTNRSANLTLVVPQPPDFSMSVSPASVSVLRGTPAKFTVSVAALAGFVGKVALSRSALPYGCTTTWSKNPIVVSGSSVLTIKTTSSTPRGTFSVVITGKSGSLLHRVIVNVTVR